MQEGCLSVPGYYETVRRAESVKTVLVNNGVMGGYGAYVWSCFALTAAVLIIATVQARHRQQKRVRELRARARAASEK